MGPRAGRVDRRLELCDNDPMTERPKKKGLPTAVKVLLIVGLLFLLFVGGFVGVCAYCVASNPELRQMGELMGETVRMGMAATKAPGTQELRDAGCAEAMVVDMRRVAELAKELDESESGSFEQRGELDAVTVVCQVDGDHGALACEDVARTYGAAVADPPAEFVTVVQTRFAGDPVCQGVYRPDGTRLREAEPPQAGAEIERPIAEEGEPLFQAEEPPAEVE
jgi:hypothetical protein